VKKIKIETPAAQGVGESGNKTLPITPLRGFKQEWTRGSGKKCFFKRGSTRAIKKTGPFFILGTLKGMKK